MNEQEQKDLDELKAAIQKEKLNTYSYLTSLSSATETELKHSGYGGKTNAEAVYVALKRSLKKIDKLIADHVKRYPDE